MGGPSGAQKQAEREQEQQLQQLNEEKAANLRKLQSRELASIRRGASVGGGGAAGVPSGTTLLPATTGGTSGKIGGGV